MFVSYLPLKYMSVYLGCIYEIYELNGFKIEINILHADKSKRSLWLGLYPHD